MRNSGDSLGELAKAGGLRCEIGKSRSKRSQARPFVDKPKGIGVARPQASLPVMGQELRFVGRNVHVYGTVALTAFAAQAKVQSLLHALVAPSLANDTPLHHFPKGVGASACRVALFPRDHETRAHGVLDAMASEAAAFAYTHATQRGARKAAVIIGKFEMRLRLPRFVPRIQAQIFVHAIRFHDFARVHFPIGIPDRLEFMEGLQQFWPEHFLQELRARLPVTVLPRERSFVAHHEIGRLLHEIPELLDACFRVEVEVHAAMNASLPEVPIK